MKSSTVFFKTALALLFAVVSQSILLAQTFVHPGGLHTMADLDRMKAKVAAGEHPWIDDWNVLIKDGAAQNTYSAAARGNMGTSRQRADADAHAAYLNAIRWYITGDTTYAACAVRICNAWGYTVNQVPTGTDIPGLSGIPIFDFALAAEVLRIYPGWKPADLAQFKNMMLTYWYPVCHSFLTTHNGLCSSYFWANWDIANTGAMIAMGVLLDDTAVFNEGINYFKNGSGPGNIDNAVYYMHPNGLGQWQESGRDQEHAQLGVGMMAYYCQVAWNQGIDLFGYENNKLLAGAEYVAHTTLSLPVPYQPYNNCDNANQKWLSTNGLGRLDDRPVWELLYNHYAVLQGLSAPNVQAMAGVTRPEAGSIDHFGYGTLTFTLNSGTSPYPPAPAPQAPAGLTAAAGVGNVSLVWQPADPATVQGYSILRSATSGGPYSVIATWNRNTYPGYTDYSVKNDSTYYYVISANNQAGVSSNSAEVVATPRTAKATLPQGWTTQNVGTSLAGSAAYASVAGGSFLVTGSGLLGGTSDAVGGYTYGIVSGDFTYTVRLVGMGGSQTGIMARESLDPSARTFVMKRGDVGWREGGYGSRSTAGGSMNWIMGDDYTWLPAWYRLKRVGNTITGYESGDGITWFAVGSDSVTSAGLYVGFLATSGSISGANSSSFDNVTLAVADTTAPAAPSGLTVKAGNTQDSLTWNAVPGASGYTVKRATASGGPYLLAATNLNLTHYLDTGLVNGITYYYVVTASSLNRESSSSSEASATPMLSLPPVPDSLSAVALSAKAISLTWTTSLSASSYNVKRAPASGGPYVLVANVSVNSYIDSLVADTVTYFYVVSAVNAIGESKVTCEVSATPGNLDYWKFDETSGTTAFDSWSTRNATVNGGAVWAPGIVGNGISLDGVSGYVAAPAGILAKDFTISAWVKVAALATWERIFDFGSGKTSYMFLSPQSNTGTVRYAIFTGSGSEQQINSSSALSVNVWHHLAVTWSGNVGILYIDGVEAGRNSNMTNNPSSLGSTTQNWIGRSQFSGDPYFSGSVDEFRIYARALSAAEISSLVGNTAPPPPVSLSVIQGNNRNSLTWSAAVRAVGYKVGRALLSDSAYTTIAGSVTDTTFIDSTASNCNSYRYVVSAVGKGVLGNASDPACAVWGQKSKGTLIGTAGSWGNNSATTIAAAVDGNLGTFFDAPVASGAWVGYDLGADTLVVERVRFAPRTGFASRMVGGVFQGAHKADFSDAVTLFTISATPEYGSLTSQPVSNSTAYRYVRYLSPANGYCDIAELEWWGLSAKLPVVISNNNVSGIADSAFSYTVLATNMPAGFSAAGLPDGLTIDNCRGVISGIPTVSGIFPVAITIPNYSGSITDTLQLTVYRRPLVQARNITVAVDSGGNVAITPQQVDSGSVSYNGSLVLSLDRTGFSCADVGSSLAVTLTGIDGMGLRGSATALVTVVDSILPIAVAPAGQVFCYSGSSYRVPVLVASDNCGIGSVGYAVSGATTRNGTGADASGVFNVGLSTVVWTVTDVHGNVDTASCTVLVDAPVTVEIPDVYAISPSATNANTIYTGYGPATLTVSALAGGGTAPFGFKWSGGATTQSVAVGVGEHAVTVTDRYGCPVADSILIVSQNVACGKLNNKVVVCHNGMDLCIVTTDVKDHLAQGDRLGSCSMQASQASTVQGGNAGGFQQVGIYPNPVADAMTIRLGGLNGKAYLKLYNGNGVMVFSQVLTSNTTTVPMRGMAAGLYFVQIINGKDVVTEKILKQ